MKPDWDRLKAVATEEVEAMLEDLPLPLRQRAKSLPITFERRPTPAQCRDGIQPDTLGLFVGPDFANEEISALPVPAQIILVLENSQDMAEEDEAVFREEVATTYFHELGHYLGLDEEDLSDRGLE